VRLVQSNASFWRADRDARDLPDVQGESIRRHSARYSLSQHVSRLNGTRPVEPNKPHPPAALRIPNQAAGAGGIGSNRKVKISPVTWRFIFRMLAGFMLGAGVTAAFFADHHWEIFLFVTIAVLGFFICWNQSKLYLVFLVLFMGSGVCANELPDNPIAKTQVQPVAIHRFWDKPNKLEFGAMVGLAAFDMAQTCDNLANGGNESFLTQSCPKDLAIILGVNAGTVGLAWLLHRTGHHKLERIPMLWKAGDSINGIVYSKQHGAW
jgi:hypothetical protein